MFSFQIGVCGDMLYSWLDVCESAICYGQSSDDEQRFIEGVSAFEQGDYSEAALNFQSAYRNLRQPNLAYNIAVAFERLGDLESALSWYRTYRSFNPPDGVAIETKIRTLQKAAGTNLAQNVATGSARPQGLKTAAIGVGVVGAVAVSILGSMAMYYSGRSEETSSRERHVRRDAESFARDRPDACAVACQFNLRRTLFDGAAATKSNRTLSSETSQLSV